MSAKLWIDFPDDVRSFAPGERIEGVAAWAFDEPPPPIHLALLWFTSGKGDRDVGVRELITFDGAAAQDSHTFSIVAPNGPSSFSGRLISITWALELAAQRSGILPRAMLCARTHVHIGPNAGEIRMTW